MSDLISRSALLKYMETNEISQYIDELNKGNDNYNSTPLYDFVKNMPTAYDVEKVVKKLKQDTPYITKNGVEFITIGDAVCTVRKGGVE